MRATAPLLDRLAELRADDERAAAGLARTLAPAQAQQEREALKRNFEYLDSQGASAMEVWLNESKVELAKVRIAPIGGDQTRMVDLLEADQLARSGTASDDLVRQAAERLDMGDHRGSKVRLDAARLGANGKRVPGLDTVTKALENVLDEVVPERQSALATHRSARMAFADAAIDRVQTRQIVATLAGNVSGAARASAHAKLKAYDQAKAKGETYEQEVDLKPTGVTTPLTVSSGG